MKPEMSEASMPLQRLSPFPLPPQTASLPLDTRADWTALFDSRQSCLVVGEAGEPVAVVPGEALGRVEHLGDEGEVGRVGGGEGAHVLATVGRDVEAVEAGDDEALGVRLKPAIPIIARRPLLISATSDYTWPSSPRTSSW